MKKLFTLLMLMVLSIGGAWAQGDVFTISYNGSDAQSTEGYFTHSGKHNINTKFTGGTYAGINFTSGLKMEGTTEIYFTSTSEATVTIVQSTWESNGVVKTNKLDEDELTDGVTDATNNVVVHTIEKLAAGEHKISRGSGENGIYYIKVEYTGVAMQQLDTPEISYNETSGEVTISDVPEAVGVYYTTDGSAPTETSTKYDAPFIVEDGTIVKAIAVGDGTTTINSSVAECVIVLKGVTLEAPVIKSYNGTVAITCQSPNVTIEYSTNGTDYTAYSRAFTLTESATVYARATREGAATSEIAEEKVEAVPANVKSRTIYMGYGSFDLIKYKDSGTYSILKGSSGDDAEGYQLELRTSGKEWSASDKIACGSESRTSIKLSNGAPNALILPEGVKATRLTIYSFVNAASGTRTSGWCEINGEDLTDVVNEVPMGATSDLDDRLTNPDVRIFPLDNVTGEITFKNTGEQLCFAIALDVIETPQTVAISDAKFATCVAGSNLDFAGTDVTAYAVTNVTATTVELTEVEKVAKGQVVVIGAAEAGEYEIPMTTKAVTVTESLMKSSDTDVNVDTENYYIVADGEEGVGFYLVKTGTAIPAGKGYLVVESAAKFIGLGLGATGINEVKASAENNGEIYNLNGQRVATPAKGLYIMNGKKVIFK